MTVVRKGKAKERLSSQSNSSSSVGGMMSTLMRLSTSFTKLQLWKQWNKLNDCFTVNMDEEELRIHHDALQLIQSDLQVAQTN
jgi:hypothetical protein